MIKAPTSFDVAKAFLDSGTIGKKFIERASTPSMAGILAALGGNLPGYVVQRFNFTETTLNGDPWTQTKDAGAADFSVPSTGIVNGAITNGAGTGAGSGDGQSLLGKAVWRGDNNCFMLIRLKSDVVTTLTLEAGFLDDVTNKTTPAVSDIDTPTIGAGNAELAVLHLDTAETLATMGLVTQGSGGLTAAKTTLSTLGGATTFLPTADTFFSLLVALNGNHVHTGIFNAAGNLVARAVKISGIEGGTLVAPWFAVATLTTASKVITIDDVLLMQDAGY